MNHLLHFVGLTIHLTHHVEQMKLEGNGPVESAGDGALKINAGLVVGVGDISLSAVDRVSNLRRPLSPIPFCSWGISLFSRRSFVICGQYDIM